MSSDYSERVTMESWFRGSAYRRRMARAKPDLTDWWFTYLTEEQRERLLTAVGEPLHPDLALELWRGSHTVRVVEPEVWQVGADPSTWRLTPAAAAFVAARARERAQG